MMNDLSIKYYWKVYLIFEVKVFTNILKQSDEMENVCS